MTPASIVSGADQVVPLKVRTFPPVSASAQKCLVTHDTYPSPGGGLTPCEESASAGEDQDFPFHTIEYTLSPENVSSMLASATQKLADEHDTELTSLSNSPKIHCVPLYRK